MSCIFCRIAAGEIPAERVYEDDHVLAFLDLSPLEPGHVLLVPRDHHELFEDLPAATLAAFGAATARLAAAAKQAAGAEATTLAVNNGRAAGQEVPHCHLHIVPRRAGDSGGAIHALFGGGKPADDLGAMREAIVAALG
jgi:histidine triad (HIT) family protein